MARKPAQEPTHTHHFLPTQDIGAEKCACNTWRISVIEFDRRKAIWDQYYEDVKGTTGYRLYKAMAAAVKVNDHQRIKVIRQHLTKYVYRDEFGELQNVQRPDRLPKPPFPDPVTVPYVVEN